MDAQFYYVIQIVIGLVFLMSSSPKVLRPREFARALDAYQLLPRQSTLMVAVLVIGTELLVALAHLSGIQLRLAVAISAALLITFLVVVLWVLRRGATVPCACFSASNQESISGKTAIRLVTLIAAELLIWFSPQSISPVREFEVRHAIVSVVTAALVLTLSAWTFLIADLVSMMRGSVFNRPQKQSDDKEFSS